MKVKLQTEGDAKAALGAMAREVRSATRKALNLAARKVRDEETQTIAKVFDRPTRWTRNAVLVREASARGALQAEAFIRDDRAGRGGRPAAKYLTPNIDGGGRALKAFEKQLQRAGLMPAGWKAVPTDAAPLDAHGNVPGGKIVQIMSHLNQDGAFGGRVKGISANPKRRRAALKRAGGQYVAYAVKRGNIVPGVYRRSPTDPRARPTLIFAFVPVVRYRQLYPFQRVGEDTAALYLPQFFQQALREAKR